jgi:hypothetical protein
MNENGRGARPIAKLSNSIRIGKRFCPNLPEVHGITTTNGHEKSLEGKQASREESYIPKRRTSRKLIW